MGVELLRRRRTGLGEKKKKSGLRSSRCSWIMSALTHSGCNNWHVSQDLACLKRVGGEPERRCSESLLPPRPRRRLRFGREYSSYGRVASCSTTCYTVHASETLHKRSACMYCVSRRILYVRRPQCVRVWYASGHMFGNDKG